MSDRCGDCLIFCVMNPHYREPWFCPISNQMRECAMGVPDSDTCEFYWRFASMKWYLTLEPANEKKAGVFFGNLREEGRV